ncbi:MAG: hypothetical protein N2204_03585 [Anaerolineae bacterium]|nr:hypothetical protein [Anaerolineae bacterium]
MWTVAVALTGNELGLTAEALAALLSAELATRREQAHTGLEAEQLIRPGRPAKISAWFVNCLSRKE